MNAYTPGPWVWGDRYDGLFGPGPDNAVLEYASYEGMWLPYYRPEGKANACLIAASPDLLEALKAMDGYYAKRWTGGPDDFTPEQRSWIDEEFLTAWRQARAAIAKAGGKA